MDAMRHEPTLQENRYMMTPARFRKNEEITMSNFFLINRKAVGIVDDLASEIPHFVSFSVDSIVGKFWNLRDDSGLMIDGGDESHAVVCLTLDQSAGGELAAESGVDGFEDHDYFLPPTGASELKRTASRAGLLGGTNGAPP